VRLLRSFRVERPLLLIVVERDDEARLQALRRRIMWLNGHYRLQLDVRLTRADLLDDGKNKLNPTKPVWRTVEASEFGYAFDQPAWLTTGTLR